VPINRRYRSKYRASLGCIWLPRNRVTCGFDRGRVDPYHVVLLRLQRWVLFMGKEMKTSDPYAALNLIEMSNSVRDRCLLLWVIVFKVKSPKGRVFKDGLEVRCSEAFLRPITRSLVLFQSAVDWSVLALSLFRNSGKRRDYATFGRRASTTATTCYF
jgi:hypothetical protein